MSYYRIKIEEKNNGEKGYIPQVCKLEILGRWLKRRKYGLESAIKSNSLSVQVSYKEDYDRPALLYIHDRNFIKEMMEKELDSVNQEL